MRYRGTVIRPPSEANSYILQVTYGCSQNSCTFCGTYLGKPFQVRPVNEVFEDIEAARQLMPGVRRVFLADGDAMVLSNRRLVPILEALSTAFPRLERVGVYANAQNLQAKSVDALKTLRSKGLGIVYLGLESGSEEVLRRVDKGSTAAEMIRAVGKAKAAGLETSVIAILGLAGPDGSGQHAEATGKVVSRMDPDYLAMLTLMLVPGTELYREWEAGEFELMAPEAMLAELGQVVLNLEGLTHCVFRTNHASNYLPLRGTLPKDKPRLLEAIETALALGSSALRPEEWRGL